MTPICRSPAPNYWRPAGREIAVGGLNLTLRVERIADLAALPVTVNGKADHRPAAADSAVYLRARQADGHQVWTSPLFIIPDATE